MEIRLSTDKSDISAIMKIVKTFGGSDRDLQSTREYVLKELEELGDNRILFLGYERDEPVGVVQLLLKKADNNIRLADGVSIAHVHALQVATPYHRQGKGYALMCAVEGYCTEKEIKRLTLGVDSDNDKAMSLYEKLGYQLLEKAEGRTPEVPLYYLYKDL